MGEAVMSARGRSKSRCRDVSLHRYHHPWMGAYRAPARRAAASALPSRSTAEAPSAVTRPIHRPVETKTIMRLDGDSIAYFWALETETAISYEVLAVHWRAFADVLTNSWALG